MKRKAIIRFFVGIGWTLALCIGLTACFHMHTDDERTTLAQEQKNDAGYTIVNQRGKFYLVFKNNAFHENNGQNVLATVKFDSIKEFRDAVLKDTLAEQQKTIIATAFPKDKNGILVCDFNNLYAPVLPASGYVDSVYWGGESYSFALTLEHDVFGVLHYYTASQYSAVYQSDYENIFDKDTITVTKTEHLEGDKTATYYFTSTGEFMQIRYPLSDNEKTIIVDKTYRLKMADPAIDVSSSVPSNVTLYCAGDSKNYVVDLFGFTKDPADAWLLEFGLTPYIENDVIDK